MGIGVAVELGRLSHFEGEERSVGEVEEGRIGRSLGERSLVMIEEEGRRSERLVVVERILDRSESCVCLCSCWFTISITCWRCWRRY